MNTLALDFGHGRVKLAILGPSGEPTLLTNRCGNVSTPNVVFFADDEDIFGEEAVNIGIRDPRRLAQNFKRCIGTDQVVALGQGDSPRRARDCFAAVVKYAKKTYEAKTGDIPQCVTMAVPVKSTQQQREEVLDVIRATGLEVLQLLNEPDAAALGNKIHERGDGLYLIIDLGHGTLDVSVIRVEGTHLEIMASGGDPQLGGQDFNDFLIARTVEQIHAEHGIRLTRSAHPLEYLDLEQRIEQAKHTLSLRSSCTLVATCEGRMSSVTITRDEFQHDCAPLLKKAERCILDIARAIGTHERDLREVILVGGASAMPMFGDLVQRAVGKPPSAYCEPQYAVVFGCAIAGRMELDRQSRPVGPGGTRLPPIDCSMQSVSSHAIGVAARDRDRPTLTNSVLVHANTPLPFEGTLAFELAESGQTSAQIELLEGSAGAKREDCNPLGCFVLDGLPPVTDESHQIDVTIRIDRSGIIHTEAKDTVSDKSAKTRIDPSAKYESKSGLSERMTDAAKEQIQ